MLIAAQTRREFLRRSGVMSIALGATVWLPPASASDSYHSPTLHSLLIPIHRAENGLLPNYRPVHAIATCTSTTTVFLGRREPN
ncbi:twin-arginine translocation signal domain-containing protein [Collimonas pratensis]|uniref:twin-arginine translocation signal domain-containing protein n=2 Tax=Collimonas TaxID=202907 RepID=UPI003AAF6D9C